MTLEQIDQRTIARCVLQSIEDDYLVMAIPGTEYRLHLVPSIDANQLKQKVGKRLKGTIHAKAMKIHSARGGGLFIEPVLGSPRIVAGVVIAIDERERQVCVDVSVPMWVSLGEDQDLENCVEGELVNFYVQSGSTFKPLDV
ncbi:MAG: hypothetical protein O7G85_06405 [Planctomycetota bacterium]|nr:hypothetical protein [Planctomycetota bacterium]